MARTPCHPLPATHSIERALLPDHDEKDPPVVDGVYTNFPDFSDDFCVNRVFLSFDEGVVIRVTCSVSEGTHSMNPLFAVYVFLPPAAIQSAAVLAVSWVTVVD